MDTAARTRNFLALVIAIAIGALAAFASAAEAAKHVDRLPGGRIVLKQSGSELRKLKAKLPANCESSNGVRATTKLRVSLKGRLPLENGRFRLHGEAPNGVEVALRARRVPGGLGGRIRLTYLDLDFVGPSDDSYLCDTGRVKFTAS